MKFGRVLLLALSLLLAVSLIACGGETPTVTTSAEEKETTSTTESVSETIKATDESQSSEKTETVTDEKVTEESAGGEPNTTETETETVSESETETVSESETEAVAVTERDDDAYYIIEAVAEYGRNGLANGWKYDNRFDLSNITGLDNNILFDKSDDKFYRLIRDFKSEDEGFFKLEMILNAESSEECVYVAMCGENDERLFYLTAKDGVWVFVGESELVTDVAIESAAAMSGYGIEIEIDLDANKASLTLNNKYYGEIDIPDMSMERVIIGTNKVGTATVGFQYVRLMKNYPIVDRFILGDIPDYEGQAPANWTVSGDFALARISSMRIYDMYSVKAESTAGSVSSAVKSFRSLSGIVSFDTSILLPEKTDGAGVSMLCGGKKVITFETRDGKIYVGDEMVNDYIPNVWQTLHVDADTNTGKAKIFVNGKHKATVDFTAEYFDGVSVDFAPDKDAVMWFDDVEAYEIIKHADYPSVPQVAESTDYNVGMNVCWLWRDQQSGEGWDAVSPFKEFDPYLGFYDEGLRETADWELKWMAEHGIDFIHACWYCPSDNIQAPIKEMRHSYAALHDGYMMAEYSDLVDFCIMWENNAVDCYSFEQFKEYIWNYWCEYYFSDPRYARLDNMAVISIWNRTNFETAMGGADKALEAMEWMREEIKKYGYDGMIFLAQTQGSLNEATYEKIASQGYDATYGYHWGPDGNNYKHQYKCNKDNFDASEDISHHIPTISIGFNDIGRNDTRDPIINVKGHDSVCNYSKNLLKKLETGTWKDNTVMLSTWNEFSEGTYMFPTKSTGFEYLENVRKNFTNDTSDHTELDVMPTEAQKDRVTHLYPEDHSPIRWYQFEVADTVEPDLRIKVNGSLLSFKFNPQLTEDGDDYVVVGEAKGAGFYSMLRVFYEWDRFTGNGVLTLHTYDERTLVFTVGSDKVMVDSVETDLGFTFKLRDGLPTFHIKKLCDLLGYKYTVEDDFLLIQACSDEEYETLKNKVENQWDFGTSGEMEGWKIQQGSAIVGDNGTMEVTPSGVDIAIIHDTYFEAGKYNIVRVGIKYNEDVIKGTATLFFRHKSGVYTGDNAVYAKFNAEGKGEGDIVEVIFKLSDCPNYYGTITGLRIDPFTGLTPFEVDYVYCEYDPSYSPEGNLIEVDDENQWYFDTQDEVKAWYPYNATLHESNDGYYHATASNTDPYITATVNFRAIKYQVLIVKMKYSKDTANSPAKLYFITDEGGSWSESKAVNGLSRIPEDIKEGDDYLVVFDLASCSAWGGTITRLRIDPIGAKNSFKIEEIRLCQVKGMEMDGAPATKPTEATILDPENIPEGIEVKVSGGAKLEIVADPTDPTKKVFKVTATDATPGGKVYTYLDVYMHFAAGENYKISYKIMPLTDINGADFENTIIGGNLIYGTSTTPSAVDHAFDASSNKSTSSEWIQCSFTRSIPRKYSAGDKDRFQIWGKFSPSSGCAISYLVTDIVIEIIK